MYPSYFHTSYLLVFWNGNGELCRKYMCMDTWNFFYLMYCPAMKLMHAHAVNPGANLSNSVAIIPRTGSVSAGMLMIGTIMDGIFHVYAC